MKYPLLPSIATLLTIGLAPLASGAAITWDGGGSPTFNWSGPTNWNPDTAPAGLVGNDLVFAGTLGGTNSNDITGNPLYSSLAFTGNTGWTINAATSASTNAFQVSNGISLTTSSSVTINPNITLTASQSIASSSIIGRSITFNGSLAIGANTITVDTTPSSGTNSGNTVVLNGGVSGAGGSLIKDGIGTLALKAGTNTNSFTGNIQVNAGFLQAEGATALGTGSGTTTISSGASLTLNGGGVTIAEAITVSGAGATTGGGSLLRGAIGTGSSGPYTLSGPITLAGNTDIGQRASSVPSLTISGAIGESSAGMSLNKVGSWADPNSGFLKLTGANTYTGTTTVKGGGLVINGTQGSATSEATRQAGYNVTFENLTTVQTGGAALTSQSVLSGTGSIFLKSTASINIAGASSSLLATLAPGNVTSVTSGTGGISAITSTIGTLVINGTTHVGSSPLVTFGDNSNFMVQLDSTKVGGTAGASDILLLTGGYIDLTSTSNTLTISMLGAGTLSGDYILATFDTISPATYGAFETVVGLPTGYNVIYNPMDIRLSAVPEPGTSALLIMAISALVGVRKMRRR